MIFDFEVIFNILIVKTKDLILYFQVVNSNQQLYGQVLYNILTFKICTPIHSLK